MAPFKSWQQYRAEIASPPGSTRTFDEGGDGLPLVHRRKCPSQRSFRPQACTCGIDTSDFYRNLKKGML